MHGQQNINIYEGHNSTMTASWKELTRRLMIQNTDF